MKKSIKISVAVISAAAVAAAAYLGFRLVCPGYESYRLVKDYCPSVDKAVAPYPYADTEIPEDYQGCGANGMTLELPPDFVLVDMTADGIVYGCASDENSLVIIQKKEKYSSEDLLSGSEEFAQEDLEKLCSDIGRKIPDSFYSLLDAEYNIKSENLNIHSKGEAEAFEKLAVMKETAFQNIMDIYSLKTEKAAGFVYKNSESEYTAELFPNSDGNTGCSVYINSENPELIQRIIASADIVGD